MEYVGEGKQVDPRLERQKVVFENLALKSPLIERIKKAQKKNDMLQK